MPASDTTVRCADCLTPLSETYRHFLGPLCRECYEKRELQQRRATVVVKPEEFVEAIRAGESCILSVGVDVAEAQGASTIPEWYVLNAIRLCALRHALQAETFVADSREKGADHVPES